ncbi:MAG: COX15/CtaA family protein [Planctomycetota bacterium]|nr:COX15/CtaA family protein [Planctomycetota bacterium]
MSANQIGMEVGPPVKTLHRLAVLAVCLVWPLIWVGGLVTTYDAGMAVPDWPGTYGYNLFLYPLTTWVYGPFDLLIEHGHRLLGAVVGLVAIGLVVAAKIREPRRWVLWLAVGILAAVISQGLLGGMRVMLGDRTLAMIHGCFGPAVFSLCVVCAVVNSSIWSRAGSVPAGALPHINGRWLVCGGAILAISYLQLVLGAQLRHVQPITPPRYFTLIVAIHVMTAFALWILTGLLYAGIRRCGDLTLSRPGGALIGLVGVQIALGTGTWVVNYGWPVFLKSLPGASGFLIQAKGFTESIIVTAHVATGSLILAVATLTLLRMARIRRCQSQTTLSANLG